MITAKEFYNSRAIKHQLKRAIKHDKQYFEDAIIELMEMYAQEQVKNLTIPVIIESLPLDEDQTWPTRDVLNKLIEASEILLHKKDYDGHGWEEIAHCVDLAKDIEKRMGNVL